MSIPAPRESDVLRAVLALLAARGIPCVRVNGGACRTAAGGFLRFNRASRGTCSDVLACIDGRFVAFELKRPGGKATAAQGEFLAAVRAAGGVGAVVAGVADAERVIAAVREGDL